MRRVIRKYSRYHNYKLIAMIAQTATSGLFRVNGVPAGGYHIHRLEELQEGWESEPFDSRYGWYLVVMRDGTASCFWAYDRKSAKVAARRSGLYPVASRKVKDQESVVEKCDF